MAGDVVDVIPLPAPSSSWSGGNLRFVSFGALFPRFLLGKLPFSSLSPNDRFNVMRNLADAPFNACAYEITPYILYIRKVCIDSYMGSTDWEVAQI